MGLHGGECEKAARVKVGRQGKNAIKQHQYEKNTPSERRPAKALRPRSLTLKSYGALYDIIRPGRQGIPTKSMVFEY